MDWNMFLAVAQTIAAIGVAVSVIYVARQVKETNAMTRSTMRQEVSAEISAWAMAVASSPQLSEAMAKVDHKHLLREDATETEKTQIGYAYVGFIGAAFLAHQHMEDGIISQEKFEELFGRDSVILTRPYLKTLWPVLRGGYSDNFARWLENRYGLAGAG